MADSTIPGISTTATFPLADDYLELGGVTGSSRKILAKNLTGGRVLKSGVAPLTGAAASTTVTIAFGSTLPEIPDHVEFFFAKLSTATYQPAGVLLVNLTTTAQFVLKMNGLLNNDTDYFVYWKAISIA